ncbi:hypothetical protein FISHEDRAFT_61664 [Fistulina hepatica ATCC 64428]|uniref:Transcription factor domain-containing protein n=1 Tax=Fistulina hepatica ATCC 64428 TaxID=1128425 RepID=A0A0D7A4K3_9AGAR|nr:hypothetical protein FISHEDRAFT_61664 [Fistulina hepatica ATCC 64428]
MADIHAPPVIPPQRKQNTACDACRVFIILSNINNTSRSALLISRHRKVKCIPVAGSTRHCVSKNIECTHKIQQETSEKKRNAARRRTNTGHSTATSPAPGISEHPVASGSNVVLPSSARSYEYVSPSSHMHASYKPGSASYLNCAPSINHAPVPGGSPPTYSRSHSASAPSIASYLHIIQPRVTPQTCLRGVLAYLFAPPEADDAGRAVLAEFAHMRGRLDPLPAASAVAPYASWGARAHMLVADAYRYRFANELVDAYFQIVHTRFPLLNPAGFRRGLRFSWEESQHNEAPGEGPLEVLHPALVAAVLAWGAKFVEHALVEGTYLALRYGEYGEHSADVDDLVPETPDTRGHIRRVSESSRPSSASPPPPSPAPQSGSGSSPSHTPSPPHDESTPASSVPDRDSPTQDAMHTERPPRQTETPFAKTMIRRARTLAELLGVHREPKPDHVVISLLLEPLQSQDPEDPLATMGTPFSFSRLGHPGAYDVPTSTTGQGYHGFWLRASLMHLIALRINHKVTLQLIPNKAIRGTLLFAWWMALIADAYGSMYYRRKPVLDEDDYDVDFYTVEEFDMRRIRPATNGVVNGEELQTREQLQALGYYQAAHALARIARTMSRHLWTPRSTARGLEYARIKKYRDALMDWHSRYLDTVGVPKDLTAPWDFVSAVSTCASDASYHVMWIVLFNALDEFGLCELSGARAELLELRRRRYGTPPDSPAGSIDDDVYGPHTKTQIPTSMERGRHEDNDAAEQERLLVARIAAMDTLRCWILDEALHAAIRIGGLAGVLTRNEYLKLDPAVMLPSCVISGMLLARFGRMEVRNCIEGLEQYGCSYEEAGRQASELARVYQLVRNPPPGPREGVARLGHMEDVAFRDHSNIVCGSTDTFRSSKDDDMVVEAPHF